MTAPGLCMIRVSPSAVELLLDGSNLGGRANRGSCNRGLGDQSDGVGYARLRSAGRYGDSSSAPA